MSPRLTPIRLALLEQERTQKWLAERVGKSRPVISRIVNGLIPDEPTRLAIAAALSRPVGDLWPSHDATVDQTSASPIPADRRAA